MIHIEPESAVAHNGLAEVFLQAGKFEKAHEQALIAYELAPEEWVAVYNLGMIEDRLQQSEAAIQSLNKALQLKIPMLVTDCWFICILRAHGRLGDFASAEEAIAHMRKQKSGLEEWQVIMGSEEAATLREVLEEDIQLVQELVDGELEVSSLVDTSPEIAAESE